jgi:ribosome maturation factor RimP
MNDQQRIAQLLEPYLGGGLYYVVDCQVAGRQGGTLKVTVLLDSDAGITIDECARIGRQLGNDMDEQNVFGEAVPFNLEVSSPGVDFPLSQPRQFQKNVGRTLKVDITAGQTLVGTLLEVTETGIVLDVPPLKISKTKRKTLTELPPEGIQPIAFEAIRKATVEITFK